MQRRPKKADLQKVVMKAIHIDVRHGIIYHHDVVGLASIDHTRWSTLSLFDRSAIRSECILPVIRPTPDCLADRILTRPKHYLSRHGRTPSGLLHASPETQIDSFSLATTLPLDAQLTKGPGAGNGSGYSYICTVHAERSRVQMPIDSEYWKDCRGSA